MATEPGSAAPAAGGGDNPHAAKVAQETAASDADIIGDLLKSPPGKRDESADDEPAAEAEEDAGAEGGEDEQPAEDSADDDAAPAEEDDDAAATPEPDAATLKAARKAAEEGDLDKAFELAFGKKPEELYPNDKTWTKWRSANNKVKQAQDKRDQEFRAELSQAQNWIATEKQKVASTIEALRPYEEIQTARLAFQKDGDPTHLVRIVEMTTGLTYDEAQKIILSKQRRSPGERALAQQLAELRQKLEETAAQKQQQEQQLTQQQQYANDIGVIKQQLKGEVTQVPRYAERVYQVLVKTRSAAGLTMTVEEAGRRVLAAERRKLEKHPLLKKPKPEVSQAAATLAKARKDKQQAPALRRDSRGNGATDEKTETTDDILNDILKSNKRKTG